MALNNGFFWSGYRMKAKYDNLMKAVIKLNGRRRRPERFGYHKMAALTTNMADRPNAIAFQRIAHFGNMCH